MKRFFIFSMGLISMTATAQDEQKHWGKVGINSLTPNATLEINLANINKNKATNEGILIPRLTKDRVAKIDNANLIEGTLIYIEDPNASQANANSKVAQITNNGFYHYDGQNWVKGVAPDNDTTYSAGTGITISGTENTIAINPAGITLSGDVTGNTNANTVTKIQANPVSNSSPKKTNVLQWNGENWTPSSPIRIYATGIQCDTSADINRRWATDKGILSCLGNKKYSWVGTFDLARIKDPDHLFVILSRNNDDGLMLSLRLNAYMQISGKYPECIFSNTSLIDSSGHGIGYTLPDTGDNNNSPHLLCTLDLQNAGQSATDNGLQNIEYLGLSLLLWNYEIPPYNTSLGE